VAPIELEWEEEEEEHDNDEDAHYAQYQVRLLVLRTFNCAPGPQVRAKTTCTYSEEKRFIFTLLQDFTEEPLCPRRRRPTLRPSC